MMSTSSHLRSGRTPSTVQIIEPQAATTVRGDLTALGRSGGQHATSRRTKSAVEEEANRAEVAHRVSMLSMHEELRDMHDPQKVIARELQDIERCRENIERKKEERRRRADEIRAASLRSAAQL